MNTFKKQERLKSKKLIEQLFKNSKSVDAPPLKLLWTPAAFDTEYPVQAGFAVSKRNFQKAVDRIRIKRLMREAWRLQKTDLYSALADKKIQIAAMLIFTAKRKPEFKEVMDKVAVIIQKLKDA